MIRQVTAAAVLVLSAMGTAPAHAQAGAAADENAARVALDSYGQCIARNQPQESARVLQQDFRTAGYRSGLRLLAREAESACASDAVGRGNALRSAGLLLAGSVAENWLEQGGPAVNVRLALAAGAQAETFAPSDALAQCLARSLPDQVGVLFAAAPGSLDEIQASQPLIAAMAPCAQATGAAERVEASVAALRAMIATAALRLVIAAEEEASA